MPDPLPASVEAHVQAMFPPWQRPEARRLLLGITHSPQGGGRPSNGRCEIAALKLSGGTLRGLRIAVDIHRVDFRDLLMAAGFGSDIHAHEHWRP